MSRGSFEQSRALWRDTKCFVLRDELVHKEGKRYRYHLSALEACLDDFTMPVDGIVSLLLGNCLSR